MMHRRRFFVNDDFVYILYPVSVEKLKGIVPLFENEVKAIPLSEDEDFMPVWYGTAKFPEEE